MGINIGIDLGTTYSAVAKVDAATRKPVIVRNSFGQPTTPSALCFLPDGTVLFGDEAKDEYTAGNHDAVAFYKRDMGSKTYRRGILGTTYTPTTLSAQFLRLLVADIEKTLGDTVDGVVITVPAYFNNPQVQATIDAATQAGLKVLSTIHEPTAAALAYGLDHGAEQTILFYDLGGGTFDVTIAKITQDGVSVIGSNGDHELGGKDFDAAITRYLLTQLADQFGVDPSDKAVRTAAEGKAERIKWHLSSKPTETVQFVIEGKRYSVDISQEAFADIASSLCERTTDITDDLLADVKLTWSDIDAIILVGGSTKMPMIRDYLARRTSATIKTGVNPDEAVALGAAIKANSGTAGAPLGLIGGAPAAPLLIGFKISDVVAHSMGMIAVNKAGDRYINSLIIRKNTPVPASQTVKHNLVVGPEGGELDVYVLQGDQERPLDNTVVNRYVATGITRTGKDGEIIDVTYAYDTNGLVVVTAKQNGHSLAIRVEPVPDDMSWTDGSPQHLSPGLGSSTRVILAIDLSGSMSGHPVEQAKKAMAGFVDTVADANCSVGVLLFADHEVWLMRPCADYRALKKAIADIRMDYNRVGGGNATDPFTQSAILTAGDYLVVLTDGVWENQQLAEKRAKQLHANNINVMALGFGGADLKFLKRIASVEDFADLTNVSNLSASFGRIAQVMASGSGSISMR